jgi:hypothetical protein
MVFNLQTKECGFCPKFFDLFGSRPNVRPRRRPKEQWNDELIHRKAICKGSRALIPYLYSRPFEIDISSEYVDDADMF